MTPAKPQRPIGQFGEWIVMLGGNAAGDVPGASGEPIS